MYLYCVCSNTLPPPHTRVLLSGSYEEAGRGDVLGGGESPGAAQVAQGRGDGAKREEGGDVAGEGAAAATAVAAARRSPPSGMT